MPNDDKPVPASEVKPANWEEVPSIYCNSAALVITNWDFRLLLGEVAPTILFFLDRVRTQGQVSVPELGPMPFNSQSLHA